MNGTVYIAKILAKKNTLIIIFGAIQKVYPI